MKNRKIKLANIIVSSIVCAIAVGAGIGMGVVFGQELFPKQISFNDPSSLEDDSSKLMKAYEKNKNNLSNFEPYEIANISTLKYDLEQTNHYSIIHGIADAGIVKQDVNTINIKNGKRYFRESVSTSSMVKVAKRFYQEGEQIKVYTGDNINPNEITAKWGSEEIYDTPDPFIAQWGKDVKRGSAYIISSQTVKESTIEKFPTGEMKIVIDLDKDLANKRYAFEVKSMSGLTQLPRFTSLKIEYYLDAELNIKQRVVNEVYEVFKLGSWHPTTSKLTETFYNNEYYEIPDIKTDCSYEGGK